MFCAQRILHFILLVPFLAPVVSAQETGDKGRPGNQKLDGPCSEAPAGDASPSMCISTSGAAVRAGGSIEQHAPQSVGGTTERIDLVVPEGTALRIALDQRTRISHPGDAVHGTILESVYAFDQPVIPAGSIATGKVIKVDAVPAMRRTVALANGDFSPTHKYAVTFDTVILPDGRHLAVETTASAGSARVVHLVSSSAQKQKTTSEVVKEEVKGKFREAKDQMHESWEEVSAPGRLQRLKRLFLAQMPYRRQYLEPGTRFNADLDSAISFGQIERTSADLGALASAPIPNSTLKARLIAEVTSATAARGNRVDAELTEPLYSPAHQLILPANSRIVGQVVKSKAAGKFHRNGELRLIFERIEIPAEAQRAAETSQELPAQDGADQSASGHLHRGNLRMTGNLEGVEVDRRDHMTLDEEGGAHTTDSKTRYLSTGVAILLAAAASHPDAEHGTVDNAGDPGVRTAAGGSGFRITGALISLAAKSSPVSIGFGIYGASTSVYNNFLSRGREVVFPKDTPLEIGFGSPHTAASSPQP